ncbi:MAG: hypothetical protein HQL90_08140, partial [Magnetococcales bacterium]|nr:hypothetical protein [Magnetococcales bacterium]
LRFLFFQKAADAGGKDASSLGEAVVVGHLGGVGGDQLAVSWCDAV